MSADNTFATRKFAPVLLIAAALLWSGNFIAGRALGDSVSAVGLNFWRWSIALVVLLPIAFTECRRNRREILAEWRFLAMLGLTGVAGFHIFVYQALKHTAATNALLMLSVAPAVIMIAARVLLEERVGRIQWAGIGISFAGAVVLICRGDPAVLGSLSFGEGELWMLAAVPTWTAYSILLKRRPARLSQRPMLAVGTLAGLSWMAPLVLIDPGTVVFDLTPATVAGVLYMGLGASVAAFLAWNQGVALVGPARAGVYLHLMPLFGTALAIILLDEALRNYHIVGALLVFTGIFLTQRRFHGASRNENLVRSAGNDVSSSIR